MILALGLAIAALAYGLGCDRARRMGRRVGSAAPACFGAGMVGIAGVLFGPVDALADSSLAWHMVQHLVLLEVAAPLLVLGAPHRVALAALPARYARALARASSSYAGRVLTQPAFAWLQFVVVLYGAHFSPLYEVSLEHPVVHAFEHILFLASAIVFWTPLLAVAPAPHAPSHPLRLLALFLALPMSAFLGFVFYASAHVFYAHYAGRPGALADQQAAGALMWIAGAGPVFVAFLWLVADWGARERRLGALNDATLSIEGP